jgi:hypothetical protein
MYLMATIVPAARTGATIGTAVGGPPGAVIGAVVGAGVGVVLTIAGLYYAFRDKR